MGFARFILLNFARYCSFWNTCRSGNARHFNDPLSPDLTLSLTDDFHLDNNSFKNFQIRHTGSLNYIILCMCLICTCAYHWKIFSRTTNLTYYRSHRPTWGGRAQTRLGTTPTSTQDDPMQSLFPITLARSRLAVAALLCIARALQMNKAPPLPKVGSLSSNVLVSAPLITHSPHTYIDIDRDQLCLTYEAVEPGPWCRFPSHSRSVSDGYHDSARADRISVTQTTIDTVYQECISVQRH